jgi:hypothetical protein
MEYYCGRCHYVHAINDRDFVIFDYQQIPGVRYDKLFSTQLIVLVQLVVGCLPIFK